MGLDASTRRSEALERVVARLTDRFERVVGRHIVEAVVASYAERFVEPGTEPPPESLELIERASATALQCRADAAR